MECAIRSHLKQLFLLPPNILIKRLNEFPLYAHQARPLAKELCQKVSACTVEYLAQFAVPSLNEKAGLELIKDFGRRWEDHKVMTQWIRKLFLHLNSVYEKHDNSKLVRGCLVSST